LIATTAGATANGANGAGKTVNASTSTAAVVLNGGNGADTLTGGAGNDTITGGAGADVLTGGAGADRFQYTALDFGADAAAQNATVVAGTIDTITDWGNGADVIGGYTGAGNVFTGLVGSVGLAGVATYADAVAAVDALGVGSFVAAVGTGTSWTAYLFQSTGAGADTTIAGVQLGTIVA
jgi:Ca2+-binding RTX toxin-like protein